MLQATKPYRVRRAICMGGERVEVDTVVHLSPTLGAELKAAGKVEPLPDADPAPAATDPAPADHAPAPAAAAAARKPPRGNKAAT